MLSKEECENSLKNLEEINLDIVLNELGYEKAKEISFYGMNDYPTLEKQGDIDVLRQLIKEHFEIVDKHTSKVSFLTKRIKQLEYLLERKESEFLKIEVLDKETNKKHIVGTDVHDCLLVEKGVVIYYNLQNGGSTDDYYEFVEKELYDEFE